MSLAVHLRARTRALHREAERTGVMAELLRGRPALAGHLLLLRNLAPVYEALEAGLDRHRAHAALAGLALPEIYRAPSLEADLEAAAGPRWRDALPLLEAGRAYAARVHDAAACDPALLLAHAYTRYLGDLNGGRVLERVLRRIGAPGRAAFAFYAFPGIGDVPGFIAGYRAAIDTAAVDAARREVVLDEAVAAFRHDIALSRAVAAYVARTDDAA